MQPPKLAQSFAELIAAARRFNEILNGPVTPDRKEMEQLLPSFRAWYAVEDNGALLFAPSKWIGYADLDVVTYLHWSRRDGGLHGGTTEKELAKFSRPCPDTDPLWDELRALFEHHGKRINKLARLSRLVEGAVPETVSSDDPQVNAMVALYNSLQPARQRDFLRLIAT